MGIGEGDVSWQLAHIVYKIHELIGPMNIVLVHACRSQNDLVDRLSTWGIDHGESNIVGLPEEFESVIL